MSRTLSLLAILVAHLSALADDSLPPGAVRRLGHNPYHGIWSRNVQFSADGSEVVVLRWGVYVSHYDRATGRVKESRTLPTDPVEVFLLLPGGEKAFLVHRAGPGRAGRYEFWNVRTGRSLGRVFAKPGQRHVEWAVPTPDGRHFITVEETDSTDQQLRWRLRKWDGQTGRELRSVDAAVQLGQDGYAWSSPEISPDGRFLIQSITIASDESEIEHLCWETDGLTERWHRRVPGTSGLLAFGGAGEAVQVQVGKPSTGLDLKTGQPTATRYPPGSTSYSTLVRGPDPNVLFYTEPDADGARVRAWDLKVGAPLADAGPPIRIGRSSGFRLSPDGRHLLDLDGVQVFDRTNGKGLWPTPSRDRHRSAVDSLAFSADGRRLASASRYDGAARVWDLATGRCLGSWPAGPSHRILEWNSFDSNSEDSGPPPLGLSADGRRLVVSSTPAKTGVVGPRVYDVETGELLAAAPIPQPILPQSWPPLLGQIAFLPNTESVAVTFHNGRQDLSLNMTVARWDYRRADWEVAGRISAWRAAGEAYDRSGNLIACGQVIAPGTGKVAFELSGGGGLVVRSGDGRFAAGQGNPNTEAQQFQVNGIAVWRDFRVWDARTGNVIATAPRLPDPLPSRLQGTDASWVCPRQFALRPGGRYLALADAGGLRLWDAATRRVIHRYPLSIMPALEWNSGSPATSLAFSPDGTRLATGLPDGTILLWEVPLPGPVSLPPETVDRLWADLMSDDAEAGWRAAWLLGDDPSAAVRLARKHVAPVEPFPADELRKLLADVESPRFAVRERATARLERAADLVGSAVAEALKVTKSEETRVRLAKVMAAVPGPERPLPAWASALGRAVSVVEHAGGDEARRLLTDWASGTPEAFLTREAKAALERLAAKR